MRHLAFHTGFARRDPQGSLANEAGNNADGDRRVRVYAHHDVVLLGTGFGPALADPYAGWLILPELKRAI